MHQNAETAMAWRVTPGSIVRHSCLLAMVVASAYVSVPLPGTPVPMTMQSLAVLLVGLWAGPSMGTAICMAYLIMVVLGLPVLAGGASAPGILLLARPSAGYLLAFVPAATVAGLCSHLFRSPAASAAFALTVGHIVIFAGGIAWLTAFMPLGQAVSAGLLPFLAGSAVKVALGTALTIGAACSRSRAA